MQTGDVTPASTRLQPISLPPPSQALGANVSETTVRFLLVSRVEARSSMTKPAKTAPKECPVSGCMERSVDERSDSTRSGMEPDTGRPDAQVVGDNETFERPRRSMFTQEYKQRILGGGGRLADDQHSKPRSPFPLAEADCVAPHLALTKVASR